jgi:hypothetical protein
MIKAWDVTRRTFSKKRSKRGALNRYRSNGNADKAEELVDDVAAEGATRWKLDSILNDLESSTLHVGNDKSRERLTAVIAALKHV